MLLQYMNYCIKEYANYSKQNYNYNEDKLNSFELIRLRTFHN